MAPTITLNASNCGNFSHIVPYIRYVAEDNYSEFWELKRRKIDDYEILLITSGTGIFIIEDRVFEVKENDYILFKPGIPHHGCSVTLPFSFLCSHFDLYVPGPLSSIPAGEGFINESVPSKPVKYHKANIDLPEYSSVVEGAYIQAIFKRIKNEVQKQQSGYRILTKALFNDLILNIVRQNNERHLPLKHTSEIEVIIDFMQRNYMKKLYLEDIATSVHLQPSYVSSLFKKLTGTTITEFLNRYRITAAKNLLVSTQNKLSDIACKTGFYDIHHFTRVFKEHEGLTPGQYRKIGMQ